VANGIHIGPIKYKIYSSDIRLYMPINTHVVVVRGLVKSEEVRLAKLYHATSTQHGRLNDTLSVDEHDGLL